MQSRLALVALSLAVSTAAVAQQVAVPATRPVPAAPPPGPPPPPPVVSHLPPPSRHQQLLDYRAADARCAGDPLKAEHVEPMLAQLSYGQPAGTPVTLRFRIDRDGRPLSIAQLDGEGVRVSNDDLMPSFAAWRFAAGAAREGCSITFYPVAETTQTASPAALQRFIALGRFRPGQTLAREAFDRAKPAGNCTEKWPQVLLQAFPRFNAIPAVPGSIGQTTLGFDIDADGEPANIRVLSSDGNTALDAAGREAIGKWRYAEGPRTGCVYPFHRNQAMPIAAPEAPTADALRDREARCETVGAWETQPELVFPDNYRRRAIEGWAIVAFDVAPWGAIGNVRVLAAEPSSEFGAAAKRVIERARKASSATGASGCTERIRFAMGPV